MTGICSTPVVLLPTCQIAHVLPVRISRSLLPGADLPNEKIRLLILIFSLGPFAAFHLPVRLVLYSWNFTSAVSVDPLHLSVTPSPCLLINCSMECFRWLYRNGRLLCVFVHRCGA